MGSVFYNPYNATVNILYSKDSKSNLFRSDLIVYLNIVGVVYMLIHSIFLRRMLVKMGIDVDKKEVSPSDYAILVRGLPPETDKDELKRNIEAQYAEYGVKISYINMCYDIEQMMNFDKTVKELSKQKGFYKLYLKKELAKNHLKKRDFLSNPEKIEKPTYSLGICKKK